MAFSLDARLIGYEVRGVSQGTSKKGNEFLTLRVESPDGKSNEISVTNSGLFGAVRQLRKGDVCNLDVAAVAGPQRSFVMLTAAPVLVPADEVDY